MYVSTAFVAKVLPLKMRFSFSVIGVYVWGEGGGGAIMGYTNPVTVQVLSQ